MTVKMPITTRAVVTETFSDSSDEEFSSQEDDTQLAHAVEDVSTSAGQSKKSHKSQEPADDSDEDIDEADTESEAEDKNSESDRSAEDGDADEEGDDDENANSGWADSIARILNTQKPKKKKTLVLSKAKKLNDPPKAKPKSAGFEVQKEDGEVTEEKIVADDTNGDKTKAEPNRKRREIKVLRVKPNVLNKDRERLLSKIATKGVVQLFNAVKQQQKEIKTQLDSAGPLEVKRDKVLKSIDKRSFLDHLMGEKGKSVSVAASKAKDESTEKTTWNVLRDDFMMGTNKMKDWDKQLEIEDGEEQMEVEQELEMESD